MRVHDLNPDGPTRTWLVEDESTRKAVLVDPVQTGVRRYLEYLAQQGIALVAVVDTHTHSDYFSGAPEVARRLGVPLTMHHQASRACVDRRVHDGDRLKLGETELIVISTPGHSHDSLSLWTHDTLLAGDLFSPGARSHFDESCADVASQKDSLARLADLDPTTAVYGTHDAPGALPTPLLIALADASVGQPAHQSSHEVSRLGVDVAPPSSTLSLAILRANTTCNRPESVRLSACSTPPEIKKLSPAELQEAIQAESPPQVVDVRSIAEFEEDAVGRIPGSLLVPLEHLEAEATNLQSLEGGLVLVCRNTLRAVLGADVLQRAGCTNVRVLRGGLLAWRAEGFPFETVSTA